MKGFRAKSTDDQSLPRVYIKDEKACKITACQWCHANSYGNAVEKFP